MNILQKALSLIRRKKPEEIPVEVIQPEPTTLPISTVTPPPDNVIYIYSHGFTNGVYKIEPDKDSFETFLEYCNQSDRIKDQRGLKEKAIEDTELKLNTATTAYAADTNTFIEKEKLASNIAVSLNDLQQQRLKKEQKETALTTQVKETIPEYAWVPALLYFSAGITFMIADISITHQITAWGFDMEGWESWVFAVGLAFTAFLVKPTFDRLLEKPFQASGLQLKTLYKYVLLGITTLGLIMLFCLGKFRSDAQIANNKLNDFSAQMKQLNPNSPQYMTLQKQYNTTNQSLNEDSMGQAGLILSGMLFAIGGAVCLSIAFGSLKQLINRYYILPTRIRRIEKEIKVLDGQIAALRSEHTGITTEQQKAEKRLAENEIPLLKEELKKLQEEYAALLTEFYEAQHGKERALYLDGRNKGEKYTIEGDLLYKVSNSDHSSPYLNKQDDRSETTLPPSSRPYTRRPFVKMRKMIADNFNKNQNNQTHDGTEFEIVS